MFTVLARCSSCDFLYFNDTATPQIYTLSLHDALPISVNDLLRGAKNAFIILDIFLSLIGSIALAVSSLGIETARDRKSTRLNSSHRTISYAVFCLKKKNRIKENVKACNYVTSFSILQL